MKAKTLKAKPCIDCIRDNNPLTRPIAGPGPRCATHHRAAKKAAKDRAHERRVAAVYGLEPGQYEAIYQAQGGKCAICQRATGTGKKRLSVDHDHSCCPGPTSCGKCVRGLACASCNQMLGHLRDDPQAFMRGAEYLRRPPAHAVLLGFDPPDYEVTTHVSRTSDPAID